MLIRENKISEMRWYSVPYLGIRNICNIFVIVVAFLLAKLWLYDGYGYHEIESKYGFSKVISMTSSSTTQHTHHTFSPISLYAFNTTEAHILKNQWTCNTSNMIPGTPRITLADMKTGVSFPWIPFMANTTFLSEYDNKYSALYKMQICMTNWLKRNKNKIVCASSYNFGSSTKAVVIIIKNKIKVLWNLQTSSALNVSKRDSMLKLKMTDLIDSTFKYTISAPRRIKVNYTEVNLGQHENNTDSFVVDKRQIILTNLQAHCVWAFS